MVIQICRSVCIKYVANWCLFYRQSNVFDFQEVKMEKVNLVCWDFLLFVCFCFFFPNSQIWNWPWNSLCSWITTRVQRWKSRRQKRRWLLQKRMIIKIISLSSMKFLNKMLCFALYGVLKVVIVVEEAAVEVIWCNHSSCLCSSVSWCKTHCLGSFLGFCGKDEDLFSRQ